MNPIARNILAALATALGAALGGNALYDTGNHTGQRAVGDACQQLIELHLEHAQRQLEMVLTTCEETP